MELQGKPDFERALKRIDAWFAHDVIDRPPVRFAEHNSDFVGAHTLRGRTWPDLRSRWFDAEFQVDYFLESIRGRTFYGETFPVFWPNLGPNVYAAFHGAELDYGEVTSWVRHCVHERADIKRLKFSRDNVYFQKIEELTRVALQKCAGKFIVGYTDLHGSLDCAADWRHPQQLCLDLADCPEFVHELVALANQNFLPLFDHYDAILKAHGQMSVTWMGIPARGKMHIPSCDFTNMVSTGVFDEFYLPSLLAEVRHMTRNIFHVDGKGMLRHLDRILAIPEIQAIQWVHGVGNDAPIMQWLPVVERIQAAGKGVIVDLQLHELEPFIAATDPQGLYLCLSAPESIQPDILKRLEKWQGSRPESARAHTRKKTQPPEHPARRVGFAASLGGMTSRHYGTLPTGEAVREFTLRNPWGMVAKVIEYGATLTELLVPNARGELADVVLGFKNLEGYLGSHPFVGATIGRVAGRLTGGTFSLDGRKYSLTLNDPPNHLHGGPAGFDKHLWTAHPFADANGSDAVRLTRRSPDGEEGYPGNLDVSVTFSLTGDNELVIQYDATTDRATPLSLTHHSYFNLSGEGSGSIENHHLQIHSDATTATDAAMTQLGRREAAAGRSNDLNQPRRLADVIPALLSQHGDNYLLQRRQNGSLLPAASLWDPASGRRMDVFTTDTCLQFYTGAYLDGTLTGKSGKPYLKFGGLCLECQGYPDGANTPQLGDIILRPGAIYRQTTVYRFSKPILPANSRLTSFED